MFHGGDEIRGGVGRPEDLGGGEERKRDIGAAKGLCGGGKGRSSCLGRVIA